MPIQKKLIVVHDTMRQGDHQTSLHCMSTNLAHIVAELQNRVVDTNVVGAGGLILDLVNQTVLVVRGPIKWSLPKGHLEPGEAPHQAAMREIFEETSLQIEIQPQCRFKKIRKYLYYYIVLDHADQLPLAALDQAEISEVRWCTHAELLQLDCNRQLKYFIDKWQVIVRMCAEQQDSLLLKGTVPSTEERQQLLATVFKNRPVQDETPSDSDDTTK